MSPLAVELVRRLSWFALVLAGVLFALPSALSELGVWGPSAPDHVAAAGRAIETARAYGGSDEEPSFRSAQQEAERARKLLEAGDARRARQAAREASRLAVEAQRAALTARESERRQAALVAIDIDRRLGDLEALYSEVTPAMDKDTASSLVSMMKEARRKGAGVMLAVEEGEYDRAAEQESSAKETLDAVRARLQSVRERR
jgi:hypothetical protein